MTQQDIRAKLENGTLHHFIPKQTLPDQQEQKDPIAVEG